MEILADRFLVRGSGVVVDLATGRRVTLTIEAGGSAAEQARWAMRCHALHDLRHPSVALLIDFGALGTSQRFEAWQCDCSEHSRLEASGKAVEQANRFLRACGLTDVVEVPPGLSARKTGVVVVPRSTAGYPMDSHEPTTRLSSLPPADCGILWIERPAVTAIADVFPCFNGCRPRIVTLFGPSGCGKTTGVLEIARRARLNGFVPVDIAIVRLLPSSIFRNRSLCLIDDGAACNRWSVLAAVANAVPRPHVLVVAGAEEAGSFGGVRLEPVSPERLIAAVRPAPSRQEFVRQIARAASAAQGLPGRFARLLWRNNGSPLWTTRVVSARESRVAEQPLVYGTEELRSSMAGERSRVRLRWPAPGEIARLVQRVEAARELLKCGRHAPGTRQLRQAVGGLARRGDWTHAAAGALELASALRARGSVAEAEHAVGHSARYADRARNEGAALDATILRTHLAIDRARLDEAETVASACLIAARRLEGSSRVAAASLALGRCLFWKGRYGDAEAVLAPLTDKAATDAIKLSATALAARVAVGAGDVVRAMALVGDVRALGNQVGAADAIALASYTAGFVHLSVNDLDAASRDLAACIVAARKSHDPLHAVRARILLAECARRRGPGRTTSTSLRCVRRIARHLPPIVRARAELLLAIGATPTAAADLAQSHAARSGLAALVLYVSGPARPRTATALPRSVMDEFVTIVQTCQEAGEDAALLSELCARVQEQLRAAAVAFLIREAGTRSVVAWAGGRVDAAIADRAMDAGESIPPHQLAGHLEAAAPVRYGGQTLGAVAVRWPLGTADDFSRAADILTMATVAAAPVLSALLVRRSRPVAPGASDSLGVSEAIVELRRGIERAASAPFAVLVEGESGSGKELVARALHRSGSRRDRPFCTLNCAALPDDLVEAELFGHTRGAFTGALSERPGVFEEAHGGTLLLDEVGELSARAQAKLLRVIQEGELRRLGENLSRRVDVRIVSATNRNLRHEVASGRFRLDLLYRLDVIRIGVPPLRERREDVPLWSTRCGVRRRFASRAAPLSLLPPSAALARYDWPGNVRELQNVLAALAVRSPRRGVVPPLALPPHIDAGPAAEACRLHEARRAFEARFVRAALVRTGGHRGRAAEELGVTRQGLTKLMTRLRIDD